MKMKISLMRVLILIATVMSAGDKYVSTEFGFVASFPADVVPSQVTPDVFLFRASAPGNTWEGQVKVTKNVVMPQEITKEFMEGKLAEVMKSGGMAQSGTTAYTVVGGHPALLASAAFIVDNRDNNEVAYAVVVDIKLIFVKSQNPTRNRIYMVDGMAIQGRDRSAIQSFLDSFELR